MCVLAIRAKWRQVHVSWHAHRKTVEEAFGDVRRVESVTTPFTPRLRPQQKGHEQRDWLHWLSLQTRKRFKRTLIYCDTDTQSVGFRGNPFVKHNSEKNKTKNPQKTASVSKTRSKHKIGHGHTICKFSGKCPFSSHTTTLKQHLNGYQRKKWEREKKTYLVLVLSCFGRFKLQSCRPLRVSSSGWDA